MRELKRKRASFRNDMITGIAGKHASLQDPSGFGTGGGKKQVL